MKKTIITLLLVSIFITSCAGPKKGEDSNETGDKSQTEAEVGIEEGNMAPDFTLENMDGEEVKLSDYKGKTIVLNFFGVWCPWCIKEMPGFMRAYSDYKDKNTEFLIVDVGDDKDKIKKYIDENKFDMNIVLDTKQKASQKYRVNSFPATFIIDEEGIIQKVHRQYMDEATLRSFVEPLIKK